jgi:hypothetical protein
MLPQVEDSRGSITQLANLWRWFSFALLGLLVARSCAFLLVDKEAQAEARPSGKPTPKVELAVNEPAPMVEPSVEPVLNTYKSGVKQ